MAMTDDQRKLIGYRMSASAWAIGAAKIPLDKWQQKVLMSGAKRVGILACRQAGKSTITAVKAGHTAIFQEGSTSVLVAPGERQSRLLLSRVKDALRAVPKKFSCPISKESEGRLIFENHSQIVALPGANPDALRGYSINGILATDEASWALDDDGGGEGSSLMAAVMPALSVAGGRAFFISSAGVEGSLFYKIVEEGHGGFDIHRVCKEDVPRLTPEVIEAMRQVLSPGEFQREVLNEWSSEDVGALDVSAFRAAVTEGPTLDLGSMLAV